MGPSDFKLPCSSRTPREQITRDEFKVVTDHNKRLAGRGKFLDLGEALTLKRLVSNCQYLVDKENFRISMNGDGKGQGEGTFPMNRT